MRKAVINKIHKETVKAWQKRWESLSDACFKGMPQPAKDLMDEDTYNAILKPFFELSDEEKLAVDERTSENWRELMRDLGLDWEVWDAWSDEVEQPEYLVDLDKLDLTLTPASVPTPPEFPVSALNVLNTWEYPESLEGIIQAHVAFMLCFASALARFQHVYTPRQSNH